MEFKGPIQIHGYPHDFMDPWDPPDRDYEARRISYFSIGKPILQEHDTSFGIFSDFGPMPIKFDGFSMRVG